MSDGLGEEIVASPDGHAMAAFYGCSEAAFRDLEREWWPRLFGYFRRLGAGVEDAEDLTLKTLVKLYVTKERKNFDVRRPLGPFLFKIAWHVYIGWLREQQPPLPGPEPPPDPNPDLSADLLECIERLPAPERAYVFMCGKHGLGEMSHNEIAEKTEKWPAQVTTLSQRTRRLLLTCLQAKGYR